MADEADENNVVGSDLESEVDDSGPIEYKLFMCGLTTVKVYKRMTQMKWRLHVSEEIAHLLFSFITCSKDEVKRTMRLVFMTMENLLELNVNKF